MVTDGPGPGSGSTASASSPGAAGSAASGFPRSPSSFSSSPRSRPGGKASSPSEPALSPAKPEKAFSIIPLTVVISASVSLKEMTTLLSTALGVSLPSRPRAFGPSICIAMSESPPSWVPMVFWVFSASSGEGVAPTNSSEKSVPLESSASISESILIAGAGAPASSSAPGSPPGGPGSPCPSSASASFGTEATTHKASLRPRLLLMELNTSFELIASPSPFLRAITLSSQSGVANIS